MRISRVYVIPVLVLAFCSWAPIGSQAASPTPTPGMPGMNHDHGKPNMNVHTTQVAPAVTANLLPAGKACGMHVKGGGTAKMIPVHVGKMSGPHVTLVINVHGAGMMHNYSIGGAFKGRAPINWVGTAEADSTDMHGNLHVMTRLMPMLRAGHYTAQIVIRDMSCMSAGQHPVAYETPVKSIVLK